MTAAIVFGALSVRGFPITNELLHNGTDVFSVRSAQTEEEIRAEEARELLIGRNALYHRLEDPKTETRADSIYLLDAFRSNLKENDKVKAQMEPIFIGRGQGQFQYLFFLSSLDVYGRDRGSANLQSPVRPESDEGIAANQMEVYFVHQCVTLKPERAVIFRTENGFLYSGERGAEIGRLVGKLADADFHGLEVIPYSPAEPDDSALNRKLRQLIRIKH